MHSGATLPKEELIVADLGAGTMPYGVALEGWALKQALRARILALDMAYAP